MSERDGISHWPSNQKYAYDVGREIGQKDGMRTGFFYGMVWGAALLLFILEVTKPLS